jgi:hypothetical protein
MVDLDNTVCDTRHRIHLIRGQEKPDWEAYSMACPDDEPIWWVINLVNQLYTTHTIVFMSGRSESAYDLTKKWLDDHGVDYDYVILRRERDHRSNGELKRAEVERWNRNDDHSPIVFAIDDHPGVAKDLCAIGIPTLTVCRPEAADINYNF